MPTDVFDMPGPSRRRLPRNRLEENIERAGRARAQALARAILELPYFKVRTGHRRANPKAAAAARLRVAPTTFSKYFYGQRVMPPSCEVLCELWLTGILLPEHTPVRSILRDIPRERWIETLIAGAQKISKLAPWTRWANLLNEEEEE